jgi:hypothetical protein
MCQAIYIVYVYNRASAKPFQLPKLMLPMALLPAVDAYPYLSPPLPTISTTSFCVFYPAKEIW